MKKFFALAFLTLLIHLSAKAQIDSTQLVMEMIEKGLNYKTSGTVDLGNATLTIPGGFKYLDKNQAIYVLTDLWGNPPDSSILGMLVPDNKGVMASDSWVFTLRFDELGFVKDDDADDINYDDLLEEQQKEIEAENELRLKEGYSTIRLVGWASEPYYDKDKKILHWAKELEFNGDSVHTLNYNLRLLGRKGVFVINAVASVSELPEVKPTVNNVTQSVVFNEGAKYSDFNPELDEVAAWTIGGLVAGKILAKVGFFALLLKFWKVIALAIAGVGGSVWKFIKGKKDEDPVNPNHA